MDAKIARSDSYAWQGLELIAGYGDAEAIVTAERRWSHRQLHQCVLDTAQVLREHGLRRGMAVAVLAGVPAESIFLQLALHLIGCRSAWIAPNAPRRNRVDYLRLSNVDAFVYDARTLAELGAELAATAPDLPVFCFGAGGVGPDLATARPESTPVFDPDELIDEPQSLFQTGGTTGFPKLVHQRHQFFQALLTLSRAYLDSGQPLLRHLTLSGFWHVSGQVPIMMTLFTGGTALLDDNFTTSDFLRSIARERITSTLIPPPLLYEVIDDPIAHEVDLSSLVTVSCGGSAAAPARLAQAIDIFGPVLRPVYGMSEAAFITALPGLSHDPKHPERLASCGYAYGDMRIEIRGDDGRAVLPVGETGEVWVTGGLTMAGYWGEPELTRATMVDGWIRSGDVGRLDEDGYLFLVDRVKDMIVTGYGSTNVFCRPVEDTLATHPQVQAAAVIGVPHPSMGEAVYAYVVPHPDIEVTVTEAELRTLVTDELNALWSPTGVEFIDSFPLTDVGKVDKKALRTRYLIDHSAD